MMRRIALLMALTVLVLPFSAAAPNPVPVLALKLDQATQSVNASTANQMVRFTGTASVDKLPFQEVTVTLSSKVDKGWACNVSPSTMKFTSSGAQPFTCMVSIPAGTSNVTAQLVVDGRAATTFIQSTAETKGLIMVSGSTAPPSNQTGNGSSTQGPPGTGGGLFTSGAAGGGLLGLSPEYWMLLTTAIVLGVIGFSYGGYRWSRLRARARRTSSD